MTSRKTIQTLLAAILALSLSGCGSMTGTVTPNEVVIPNGPGFYDSTVPSQYDPRHGGYCYSIKNEKGGIIADVVSSGAKARYDTLVAAYAIQFKNFRHVTLNVGDGVEPIVDAYKNNLFKLDFEHMGYFAELARWSRDKKDPDSIWMRLKDKVQ